MNYETYLAIGFLDKGLQNYFYTLQIRKLTFRDLAKVAELANGGAWWKINVFLSPNPLQCPLCKFGWEFI